MGKIEYSYVVVTVSGQKLFVNKDMDYSDNFDDVMNPGRISFRGFCVEKTFKFW